MVPLTIIALAIGLRWMSVASEEEVMQEAQTTDLRDEQTRYLDELERLAALHERGAITDVEFEEAKKRLQNGHN